MILTDFNKKILHSYTNLLFAKIEENLCDSHSTYGFEFEFLPDRLMDIDQMEKLKSFLEKKGLIKYESGFIAENGLVITFEPGGQIEYSSPPVMIKNIKQFENLLVQVQHINSMILKRLNIKYLSTDYIPGRSDAPLCLKGERYINLHKRLGFSGTMGREMMKGTASVHLHTGLLSMDEIPSIYKTLCLMAKCREFGMSQKRREIWKNTDPLRCSMPEIDFDNTDARGILEKIVHHALSAPDLYTNIPVYKMDNLTFDYFLNHLSTIFTSVRLNMKGPTFELRTLDSMPVKEMFEKLKLFIEVLEKKRGLNR
ncbi:MAG TPA: hypothetical protein DD405_01730 [Desulfobacteraceae bacterium]|nr:hypothetical protein [Desulfobacteraceae bacterium]